MIVNTRMSFVVREADFIRVSYYIRSIVKIKFVFNNEEVVLETIIDLFEELSLKLLHRYIGKIKNGDEKMVKKIKKIVKKRVERSVSNYLHDQSIEDINKDLKDYEMNFTFDFIE